MRVMCAPIVCAVALFLGLSAARGEIVDISGSSSARVIQFAGFLPIQSDFEQAIIPVTTPEPPAISRARLERHVSEEEIAAAAQVIALFKDPNLAALGNPSDVGLDLGAFSDDSFTNWWVEGTASETRTVRFDSSSLSFDFFSSVLPSNTAESSVFLSGVLLITARELSQDLTGLEASIEVKVTKRQGGVVPEVVLEGLVKIVGGPDGTVQISEQSGAFATVFLPVVDFTSTIPDLALVQAVQFNGLQLPYQYEFVSGEQFFLDLEANATLQVVPGGVGAAAVFGTPLEGLASVLQRIKNDDAGQQLVDEVNRHVDTTGASYVNGGSPFPNLFGICGAGSASATIFALAGCGLLTAFRGRAFRRHRAT